MPLPLYTTLPFVALLGSIAIGPLAAPEWWSSNRNKFWLVAGLGLPILVLFLWRQPMALVDAAEDYLSFIVLLSGLYMISGGIRLFGNHHATPSSNTLLLATGSGLASVVGTTGASMLLIRALLQMNRERTHVRHTVVFFIFLVSNIGGLLTPLGDPPLFLGYLMGVPFAWTLRLWPMWLCMVSCLLTVYFLWDRQAYEWEPASAARRGRTHVERPRLEGAHNFVWFVGVVVAVVALSAPWREVMILILAALSFVTTREEIRRLNGFSTQPMAEVALLFFGIFLTMLPALELLRLRGGEIGVREPWQFFWATGAISSFLDNAPTYVTFLALGQGLELAPEVVGVPHSILAAISVGAVAMGANTYIGNAPNLMVKAITEEAGVKMPSFFGYVVYSCGILMPLFVAVSILFFSHT